MKKELHLVLPPNIALDAETLHKYMHSMMQKSPADEIHYQILRRSIDARSRNIKINLSVQVFVNEPKPEIVSYKILARPLLPNKHVLIVGCGPAGMFAALKLLELGIKPIILERGKPVRERRRDLAILNKKHFVHPDSNYCFGEGGAGTYSDGKLYTRSVKRGSVQNILEILYVHGAPQDILYDAHPHIGTNKLPKVVSQINDTIRSLGGEIIFNERVTDFLIRNSCIHGVVTNRSNEYTADAVILATGHSARDIFEKLYERNLYIEPKPFAVGVRAEHPQSIIDSVQYHCATKPPFLPPSSYTLTTQTKINGVEKGVFSFCMCPGGVIAPCATAPGEIVVNGWSPSGRNNKWANSGIVVAVDKGDWQHYVKNHGPLAALQFQKELENKAFEWGGGGQTAPAQRITDFIQNKLSAHLPESSYFPGTKSALMDNILPASIAERLKLGFLDFGKKMKGYLTHEAQILGVESRTSSPVRILRNKETLQHVQIQRLYPCGEGAGYAGGIVSAAIDGQNVAEAVARQLLR